MGKLRTKVASVTTLNQSLTKDHQKNPLFITVFKN
jgi:hypothetical protein